MPRKGYAFLVTIQEVSESIADEGYSTYTWADLSSVPTWWVNIDGQGTSPSVQIMGHKLETEGVYVLTGERRRDLQPAMRVQWISSEKTHNLRISSVTHSEHGRYSTTTAICKELDE